MELLFGNVALQISGSNLFLSSLNSFFQKFQMEEVDDAANVELLIRERRSYQAVITGDGWNLVDVNEGKLISYSMSGKELFSLQYGVHDNQITVFADPSFPRSVQLGILYASLLALSGSHIGFHGVTLLCGYEIIVLSAPSGTGKTTLAKLLEKYCDAVVINGDFALLTPTEDGVIYEPTPFCGTSGRSLNHRFRVNRVVFLGQAKDNIWRELDGREAVARFMSNAFVPNWDCDKMQAVQASILKSVPLLKMNAYDFAPTQEAAEEFLRQIEVNSSLYAD